MNLQTYEKFSKFSISLFLAKKIITKVINKFDLNWKKEKSSQNSLIFTAELKEEDIKIDGYLTTKIRIILEQYNKNPYTFVVYKYHAFKKGSKVEGIVRMTKNRFGVADLDRGYYIVYVRSIIFDNETASLTKRYEFEKINKDNIEVEATNLIKTALSDNPNDQIPIIEKKYIDLIDKKKNNLDIKSSLESDANEMEDLLYEIEDMSGSKSKKYVDSNAISFHFKIDKFSIKVDKSNSSNDLTTINSTSVDKLILIMDSIKKFKLRAVEYLKKYTMELKTNDDSLIILFILRN